MDNMCNDLIYEEFQRYLAMSDAMIAASSKEVLIKTARILAMQAAHYASKYGEQPLVELDRVLAEPVLSEAGAIFLRDGAKTLLGVLNVLTQQPVNIGRLQ